MKRIYLAIAIGVSSIMIAACSQENSNLNFGDNTVVETETTVQGQKAVTLPLMKIDDMDIILGQTKMGELVDHGFVVKYFKDDILYDVDIESNKADAGYRYSVELYKEDKKLADVTYANDTQEALTIKDCSLDAIKIYVMGEDVADSTVIIDGYDLNELSIGDVESTYNGYKRASTTIPTYRLTINQDGYSYIAVIETDTAEGTQIADFELARYRN